ncbi:MAG: hypothetical protein AAGA85_22510 [Bacteroidota bacterium]
MRRLFILLPLITAFACNQKDEPICCTNIDTIISIKYLNGQGENLIDLGQYVESDIEVYHKSDGNWERYFQGNLDHPKGIRFDQLEDGYYLTVFPSTITDAQGLSETKIEFTSSDFDILKTVVDKSNGNEIVTKVWLDDELKWEAYENERVFEVVK